jgi:hypothetical protein
MEATSFQLKCICPTKRTLARYGIDEKDNLYLHIKVYKQRRVFAQLVINAPAKLRIQCPACGRWHGIVMRDDRPHMTDSTRPKYIPPDPD